MIINDGQRNRTVYRDGFSGTVSVPSDVTYLAAWVQAAGGAGRTVSGYDNGGGGGAFCKFETEVLPTDWGTSISLTVGLAVDDADGQASTMSGTINGVAFSVSAGGGTRLAGLGGTASGGTVNIDGQDGVAAVPADSLNGEPGLPGGDGQDWVEYGGLGGLGSSSVAQAVNGYIALEWG